MGHFKDKVAIVTGGAVGIGRAICEELGRRGAHVVIADINFQEAQQVASLINTVDERAKPALLDVSKAEQQKNLIEETAAEYGRLDYVFNNAGVSIVGDVQASGLGLGIRLVKNPENKEKFTPDEVARVAEIIFGYTVEHGVVLYPEEVQWEFFIFMFPALTITEKELKFGLDTAAGAIEQVQNEFRLG